MVSEDEVIEGEKNEKRAYKKAKKMKRGLDFQNTV